MLRRYGGWFLTAAAVCVVLLLVGLVHDFNQPDTGWLTTRPAWAGILIGWAYLSMILYQLSRRGESEQV